MEQFQPKEQTEKRLEQEKKKGIILEIGCGKSPFFIKAGRKIEKDEHYIGVDLFPASDQPLEEWLDPEETMDKLKKSELVTGQASLVSASGDSLPLEDNSVKEVIFKNVFGSPFVDSISFAKRDILDEKDETHIALGKNILLEEIDKRLWPEDKKDFYKNEIKTKQYEEFDDRLKRLIRQCYYIGSQRQEGREEHDIKYGLIDETFRVLEKEGKITIIETRTPDIALQYIQKLKEDGRFSEIPSTYKLENFVDSYTQENKLNTAATFQKK
jgi:ubiquinone/menaquinone biosynthesis C-methylase UbiE